MESTQQPTQQQRRPRRPRLERSRGDRAIAGVASGLARYMDIDVAWVRIGFVVAALFGGMGVLAYLIGWLAIPEEGTRDSIAADKVSNLEGSGSWIGIALIVLAGIIVVGNTGIIQGDMIFAAVLVGLGIMLYRGDITSGRSRSSEEEEDASFSEPVPPWVEPTETVDDTGAAFAEDSGSSYDSSAGYEAAPPTPPPPPLPPDPAFQARPVVPRESSPLGRIAMAVLLIVVGIMGVGQSAGWFDPELRHYAATVLVVLGSALLISSIYGRARGLIVVGLVLTPFLVAMALVTAPLEGGFGDPRYVPLSVADVNSEYRLIAGELVLDLTELELAEGETLTIEASVVFGRLEVIVPPDLGVNVVGKVDAGEVFLDGSRGSFSRSGKSDNIRIERSIQYEGSGTIELEAHVGFGEVEVYQIAAVTP